MSLRNHTAKEVIKVLTKEYGFYVDRQRKHVVLKHPDGRRVTVPNHPSTIIKLGTMRAIISQVKITEQEFLSHL